MTSPIAAGGLALDLAGGLALASAFMFKRPSASWTETRSYLGWNAPLLVSTAKQTADAWVGALLLTLGFSGQLTASVGWDPSWAHLSWTLPAALWFDAISGLALFLLLRPFNVRRTVAYALEHLWPEYEREYQTRDEAIKAWWQALEGMAGVAGVVRYDDESLLAFGRRFLGASRFGRVTGPPPPE